MKCVLCDACGASVCACVSCMPVCRMHCITRCVLSSVWVALYVQFICSVWCMCGTCGVRIVRVVRVVRVVCVVRVVRAVRVCVVYPFIRCIAEIVTEKEHRLKEEMKTMV